jgi:hypothetical protein
MAGCSNFTEQNFLDFYYRRAAVFTVAGLYTRLFTTSHTDWDAGTGGTELSGTGYAQYGQAAAAGTTNWNTAATQGNGYRTVNKAVAAFSWSVGSDWAALNGAGIYDGNLVGSNLLWGSTFTTPRDPASGDTFRLHNGSTGLMNFDLDVTTAAGITNTAKQALLNHIFYGDTGQVPATAYIALYTSASALNHYTGASGTEVSTSGTAYARHSVTSSTAWHAAASVGTGFHIHNGSAFNSFAAATAAWGAIRYAALVDTASGAIGSYYAIDQLAADVQIDLGDTFSIAADGFLISIDESN